MSAAITKVDGGEARVYLGVGQIVFGSDDDEFASATIYDLASFFAALEALGFLVIPTDARFASPKFDQVTLNAAEQVVRDMLRKPGRWAAEVKLLNLAADGIHKLGDAS